MSYSKITIDEIRQHFGYQDIIKPLFSDTITDLAPTAWLTETLRRSAASMQVIVSEKARSERIVTPILLELKEINPHFFEIFSGDNLNADKKQGLNGECDFIFSANAQASAIDVPIICMVEAERNDFELGKPQCMAQMIGAKVYNQKYGKNIETIYGCVTTGTEWLFMKLQDKCIYIHPQNIYLEPLPRLLGVWQSIIDYYKAIL